MDPNALNKVVADLQKRYPDAGIKSVEVDESKGTSTFYIQPNDKHLAFLKDAVRPRIYSENATTITRDTLTRSLLDLSSSKSIIDEDPKELFKKAIRYYYEEPLVGTVVNLLSSIAAKGFENDIDDPTIKNFYDTWVFDVNFEEVLEWIFLDFFKISHVTTYKYIAKYEPRVSTISPIAGKKPKSVKSSVYKEYAAKKKIWSKGHLPIGYTVLNPLLVNIEGNLLFDKVSITLTPPEELKTVMEKPASEQTVEEKELIKSLPADLKRAVKNGEDILLDSRLVGQITYKKMPYERYAKPRTARVFDTIEYKKSLKEADLSTLDGISNYILKITIGNDEYPVTSQEELEAVAQLFNTPSKSFDVVWNHTLQIEKIVSPEIESILGKAKYEQVNEDLTGGLSITRALIDGVGNMNQAEVEWSVRGLREDIEYARRQVTRWIYNEYRQIAEAMGFDRFPKVRWDEGILKDEILYKNVIAQMVDRRMLSYQTALEAVGFDYENELGNMKQELPLVQDGVFGIIGSPFQKPGSSPVGNDNIQDTQNAPKGTPSNGRPTGQTKKKEKVVEPNKQNKTKIQNPKKSASLREVVTNMTDDEFIKFIKELSNIRG